MTDKFEKDINVSSKIIIDGVDVSGCKHFCLEPEIPDIPLAGYSKICGEEYIAKYCEDNPNCYYKQLNCKEEECELLNTQLKSYHIGEPKLVAENENLNKQLQAEQQKVKELEDMLLNPEVRVALTDVRTGERELWYTLGKKAEKYKQALEEIKEIVKHYFSLDPIEISNRHIFEANMEYIQDALEVLDD